MSNALPICALPICECPTTIRDEDAGFGALRGPKGLLPLQAFAADLAVIGPVWQWHLRQTFVNTGNSAIEAVYIFPLPPRGAVTGFRLRVAGRTVIGELQERGAARATYQAAVTSGKRAALLEEERPNVFTVQVGNLQAGEAAVVELDLSGPVAVEDGIASLRLPLVVAPRYIPGSAIGDDVGVGTVGDTDAVPDASRISPPVLLPGFPNPVRLDIGITVSGIADGELMCSLPTQREGDGRWRVLPGQRLDRDCILRWPARGERLAARALLASGAPNGGHTLAVTIAPPVGAATAQRARDVVILLDRSGSMSGWKMIAARRAAARLVDALDSRDRFAALAFDDTIEGHDGDKPALHAATDRARFAAVTWLGGVEDRGGTEMTMALDRAFALLDNDDRNRERILVLVTDAQIGDEDRLLKRHAKNLQRTRVVALGVDQAVNESLLERLVAPNGGWQACVESEDWLDAVMALAARAVQPPVLTDIQIETDQGTLVEVSPDPVADLWSSRPLVVWSRLPIAPRTVTIHATQANGDPWRCELTVETVTAPALHATWARGRIRDLEDRFAVEGGSELAATITTRSLAERVLSRFTAFVAVDHVVTEGGKPTTVVQPVEQPAGWAKNERCEEMSELDGGFGGAMPSPASAPCPSPKADMSMMDDCESGESFMISESVAPPPAPSFGSAIGGSISKKLSSRSSRRRVAPENQPPVDPAQLARELLVRLSPLVSDALKVALALRSRRTGQELATLVQHLRAAQHGELADRLQAILQRIAAPATMAAVAAEWPAVSALLEAVPGQASVTPDKTGSTRTSWWRR